MELGFGQSFSSVAQLMIITCPNCQTRYQVAERAIGSAGRKVSCAQCQKSWLAIPEPEAPAPPRPKPKLVPETKSKPSPKRDEEPVDDVEEEELDAEFEKTEAETGGKGWFNKFRRKKAEQPKKEKKEKNQEEETEKNEAAPEGATEKAAETGSKIDAVLKSKRLRAMQKRQKELRKKLPMGRIRKNARVAVLLLLAGLIGGGVFFRTEVVRAFPDLAGVFSAIGLPVNIIGLEFEKIETLRTMQNGVDVMIVTGRVRNIRAGQVIVPPIVVSILDENGVSLYSWSVTPLNKVIGPFEKQEFEARLNSAPANAASVKLAFAEDRAK